MRTYDLACTVTGAEGFVGRHLVNALMAQRDYSVRVFAIDIAGTHVENGAVEANTWGNDCTWHRYDVTQPLRSDFLAVDAFYHFAGIANPQVYLDDPIRVMDLNLKGLLNVLERIVLWSDHRPRIVYSSTSEVYGRNPTVPFVEDESETVFGPTTKRRWCYAASKLVGEHYLGAYSEKHGIRNTIFRFFNFIGPDIDAPGVGRVITKMVGDGLDTGHINVSAPGTQTRTFCHSDDFVVPLVRALTMKKEDPINWQWDHTINLGNENEITILQLAEIVRERIIELAQSDATVIVMDGGDMYGKGYDDVIRRKPDGSRARDILGWQPARGSREAVVEAVDAAVARHLRGRHGAPVRAS